MLKTFALRGAVSVDRDEPSAFDESLTSLWKELVRQNRLDISEMVSLQLSQTADLRSANAAAVLRNAFPELGQVPLFCTQEADVDGAPPQIIRLLLTLQREVSSPGSPVRGRSARGRSARGSEALIPVYLKKAAVLRPDLAGEE